MKFRGLVAAAGLLVSFVGMGQANAYFDVRNNSANAVFVAYTFNEICGDDSCSVHTGFSGFRSKGWFKINPGGTSRLYSPDYRNRRHFWFAEDGLGRTWRGSGAFANVCVTQKAFDMCDITTTPCPERSVGMGEEPNGDVGCCSVLCGLATGHTVSLR